MAVISTIDGLKLTRPAWTPGPIRRQLRLYDTYNYEYAELYRLQPNIRTCVDFLSRNMAQLGLHFFRRTSETDRIRLRDYGPARLIAQPLPVRYKMTRYRLIEAMVADLGIYFNAYWLKIWNDGEPSALLRVPPPLVEVEGGLLMSNYKITIGGTPKDFPPDQIVHFRGYNPENPISGLSPLETLRRILAEEHAAGAYREGFWQNSARIAGIIQRPATAPEWSDTARDRFVAEFEELYSGDLNSGKTAVLEEGMEWKPNTFNAQESEYLAGRKLTREECARAFHIPPPMVGILDHATFSNIEEQHKQLYMDTLGPWCKFIEEDVDLQLITDWPGTEDDYSQFNIAQKLYGSFEDQAKTFQSAVGRPYMTPNEARARLNMPSLAGDADQLATPLNVIIGGQASPQDSAPKSMIEGRILSWLAEPEKDGQSWDHKIAIVRAMLGDGQKRFSTHAPELRLNHVERWTGVLAEHFRRQERSIVSRVPKGRKLDINGIWYDELRWNQELTTDLLKLNTATALEWANRLADQTGVPFSENRMIKWLSEHARIQAEGLNAAIRDGLIVALNEPEALDAVKRLFSEAITAWARRQAESGVTAASQYGANEAAEAARLTNKTWRVNSKKPRPSHAGQDGLTIPLADHFPNGQKWPGDPAGGAEENANCQCTVEFS